MWYVESSLCVIKHLKDFSVANYGAEDEAFLMRRILPSLLSQALKSLSEVKYTKEQMTDFIHVSFFLFSFIDIFYFNTFIAYLILCLRSTTTDLFGWVHYHCTCIVDGWVTIMVRFWASGYYSNI